MIRFVRRLFIKPHCRQPTNSLFVWVASLHRIAFDWLKIKMATFRGEVAHMSHEGCANAASTIIPHVKYSL